MEVETIALPVMRCKFCGHEWVARRVELPRYCPRCKNPTDKEPIKREAR
ncbi:hypothetical protein ACFLXY_06425 [Chloroflexota bacterium]